MSYSEFLFSLGELRWGFAHHPHGDQDNLKPAPLGLRGTTTATALIALTLVIAKSTYRVLVPLRE